MVIPTSSFYLALHAGALLLVNQVEQWFSILERKRLRLAEFESKDQLRAKIDQFIGEWNQQVHPFNWVHEVCRQGQGTRTCHGRMILDTSS